MSGRFSDELIAQLFMSRPLSALTEPDAKVLVMVWGCSDSEAQKADHLLHAQACKVHVEGASLVMNLTSFEFEMPAWCRSTRLSLCDPKTRDELLWMALNVVGKGEIAKVYVDGPLEWTLS